MRKWLSDHKLKADLESLLGCLTMFVVFLNSWENSVVYKKCIDTEKTINFKFVAKSNVFLPIISLST